MTTPTSRAPYSLSFSTILWITGFTIYLATRIYGITHFPIFVDEAIHVDWARATAESVPAPEDFDGRWLSIKLFASAIALRAPVDDLIASRIVVVMLGLTTLVAFYLLGRDLFSARTGLLVVALYLVAPFTILYTSMAMSDAIQLAFTTWSIWFSVRLSRNANWVDVVVLPLVLALAFLAKISAALMFLVPVLAILILSPPARWLRTASQALPAFATSLALLIITYERGWFRIMQSKVTGDFGEPVDRIWANSYLACEWLSGLLTPSVAILGIVGLLWLVFIERTRVSLFVLSLFCLTVFPYVVGSGTWYPRYLLLAVIPIFLAVGRFVDGLVVWLQRRSGGQGKLVRVFTCALFVAVLSWPVSLGTRVLFDLPQAALPTLERYQLVTGWPSGFGVKELVTFLEQQSQITPGGINVIRLNVLDHPLQSLNIFLSSSPNISLYTIEPNDRAAVATPGSLLNRPRTLLVLRTDRVLDDPNKNKVASLLSQSRVIWSYTRPGGQSGFAVYELNASQ